MNWNGQPALSPVNAEQTDNLDIGYAFTQFKRTPEYTPMIGQRQLMLRKFALWLLRETEGE